MKSFGFTLIDLLTTLAITSILLGLGLPNFNQQLQNSKVKTATETLLSSLELTRTKAVATSSRTTLIKQTTWENGWEVFIDKNNDGIRDSDEISFLKHEKLTGVRIKANSHINNFVSYVSTGESRNANGTSSAGAFQAGTFTICPEGKGKGYELILSRGGRVRQHEISAQDCAMI